MFDPVATPFAVFFAGGVDGLGDVVSGEKGLFFLLVEAEGAAGCIVPCGILR